METLRIYVILIMFLIVLLAICIVFLKIKLESLIEESSWKWSNIKKRMELIEELKKEKDKN